MAEQREPWVDAADPLQHLLAVELLRKADIEPPPNFDGSGMWCFLRLAFFHAAAWEHHRLHPTVEEIARVAKLERAAVALDTAMREVVLGSESAVSALMDAATSVGINGAGEDAARRFVHGGADGPAALVKIVRNARIALALKKKGRGNLAHGADRTPAGFLLGEALPVVFQRYTGEKPTFTPAGRGNATRASAFFRFARAAFEEDGRPIMGDDAMYEARRRWKRAMKAV